MDNETDELTTTGLRVPRTVLISDLIAGLVNAVVSIPGGIANGVLAGVNPVYGLYSMMVGTPIAALFTSSVIMNVDATSATSLATLDALASIPEEQELAYLVVLALLVGLLMTLFGILKLGSLVRFISNSVMTGFLSGLGILTILSQVGDLTGYASDAEEKVFQTIDTIINWQQIDWATFAVGLVTIILIVVLDRTKFSNYSFAVALITTTALVAVLGLESVAVVGDSASIPRSLPSLNLPDLSLIPAIFTPALVIAIIALVQAAGVSQSIPNPDGDFPDPSGDFRGQGVANIAVGFTGGISVGGSVSGTIQVQSIGGKSRWANIFTGVFATLCVLLIAPLIEFIPMATLAGTLIVVGVQMINVPRIETVWHTGWIPSTVMIITLVITLFAPLQWAVGVGVVLHMIMFIYQSAEAVQIRRVVPQPDGTFIDDDVPEVLPSGEIVALLPVGSLFFAGAAEFEEHLPEVGEAQRTVVIIGLRDRDEIGSTFVRIIERYAKQLDMEGNKLMLAGMNERIMEQLDKTELMELLGEEDVFPSEPQYFGPLKKALAAANDWIEAEEDYDKE
ncbi:MAG: STAS domain-containing protein [Chloroflexi bacterium]|nr:STAS domain-containing protein [Chloroflexota bacterium]